MLMAEELDSKWPYFWQEEPLNSSECTGREATYLLFFFFSNVW